MWLANLVLGTRGYDWRCLTRSWPSSLITSWVTAGSAGSQLFHVAFLKLFLTVTHTVSIPKILNYFHCHQRLFVSALYSVVVYTFVIIITLTVHSKIRIVFSSVSLWICTYVCLFVCLFDNTASLKPFKLYRRTIFRALCKGQYFWRKSILVLEVEVISLIHHFLLVAYPC